MCARWRCGRVVRRICEKRPLETRSWRPSIRRRSATRTPSHEGRPSHGRCSMKRLWLLLLLGAVAAPAGLAVADDVDKYAEMMRSDLRNEKTKILTEGLSLSEAEGQKFWPIYREYETQLAKLEDQRIQLIKDYAANYDKLTPETADKLVDRAFKLE